MCERDKLAGAQSEGSAKFLAVDCATKDRAQSFGCTEEIHILSDEGSVPEA